MTKTGLHLLGETTLSIIAILLTLTDILWRGSVFIFRNSLRLCLQLCCILLLSSAVVLTYIIAMALFTASGPWFNTQIH